MEALKQFEQLFPQKTHGGFTVSHPLSRVQNGTKFQPFRIAKNNIRHVVKNTSHIFSALQCHRFYSVLTCRKFKHIASAVGIERKLLIVSVNTVF